jgi:hypothetical protein
LFGDAGDYKENGSAGPCTGREAGDVDEECLEVGRG